MNKISLVIVSIHAHLKAPFRAQTTVLYSTHLILSYKAVQSPDLKDPSSSTLLNSRLVFYSGRSVMTAIGGEGPRAITPFPPPVIWSCI